jgi:hypothetical protein
MLPVLGIFVGQAIGIAILSVQDYWTTRRLLAAHEADRKRGGVYRRSPD